MLPPGFRAEEGLSEMTDKLTSMLLRSRIPFFAVRELYLTKSLFANFGPMNRFDA